MKQSKDESCRIISQLNRLEGMEYFLCPQCKSQVFEPTPVTSGIIPRKELTCPHCGKTGLWY